MGRRARKVPFHLEASGVERLADADIRTILRGADDLIMCGGRTLLARVLKGSRQQAVLDKGLDRSPVYGALRELSIEEITRRIDWMIEHRYLAIECEGRLPLLRYTGLGWALEREIYADELLERLDREIAQGIVESADISWLSERHPQVLELVAARIARSGDARYLPFLRRWKQAASRRMRRHIAAALDQLQ